MGKIIAGLLGCLLLVLISCQKEIHWDAPGTVTATGQQLITIKSHTGTDSTIITYGYDSQKRLTSETTVGWLGPIQQDNQLIINRNSSGIITRTVQRSIVLSTSGIDSLVTRYYYNTGTSRYTAAAFDLPFIGFNVTDSAVFTYDSNGRITSDDHYTATGIVPAFITIRNQYTYSADGQNLVKVDVLNRTSPGNPLTIIATETFNFDTKSNPLAIKNEAILLVRHGFYNANNASAIDYVNTVSPMQNFSTSYTYRYNAMNKPDSSFSTQTPGGTITASKYFYQ